jgi:hypothetical protein
MAHEGTHAMGAVPSCAPHQIDGGHASDSNKDLLYSGGTRDFEHLVLDFGHDDYYAHSLAGCLDIQDDGAWVAG